MTLRAVSLFTNCGAGDIGYKRAGFAFEVLAELVPHRLEVAKLNHPRATGIPGDLRETLPRVIESWRESRGEERPSLLAACPPCQGMSTARGDRGSHLDAEAGSKDPRNLLVQVVVEAAVTLNPRLIVVENVPAFLTRRVLHPKTGLPVSAAVMLVEQLTDYRAFPLVTDLAAHGVPQTRKRSFLTLVHKDEPALEVLDVHALVPYPHPTHSDAPITLDEALKAMQLPELDAASSDTSTDPKRPLHFVPIWDERRYQMIAAIRPGSGSSAWTNDTCTACGRHVCDLDATTCPSCGQLLPRPLLEQDDGTVRFITGFRRSSYARMHPKQPAATITTASGRVGSDRTIHPWQTRVLSPLECQLLQTFPLEFRWGDTLAEFGHTHLRAMIGEAVPPHFTAQHGRVLAALLDGRRPYLCMGSQDPGAQKGVRTLRSAGDAVAVEAGRSCATA